MTTPGEARRLEAQRRATWRSGRWSRAGRTASSYIEAVVTAVAWLELQAVDGDGDARDQSTLARDRTGSGDGQHGPARAGAAPGATDHDQHVDVAVPADVDDRSPDYNKNNALADRRGATEHVESIPRDRLPAASGTGDGDVE